MNHLTVLIFRGLILLMFHSCISVAAGVNWEKANKHCGTQTDSLVNIIDVQNHLSYFKGLKPIWSSVKGHFTPWIAYKGCFHYQNLCLSARKDDMTKTSCHILENNTAGNCYFECKSKQYENGGCANNITFFFGLMEIICMCMCDNNLMLTLSESSGCNSMCKESISNGECGGMNHISVYESTTIALSDAHFGGFCLTCRSQSNSNNTMLYSRHCKENAAGYCITRNGALSLQPLNSTFDLYWKNCRSHNKYIVGDTSQICHHRERSIWTGLRKYKIDNFNTDYNSCYIIEIQNGTANYNKRNCAERHLFLCKQDIDQYIFSNMEYINRTKNIAQQPVTSETSWTNKTTFSYKTFSTKDNIATTIAHSLKSNGNKVTIAGASIAGILALTFVVLLVVCFLKRQRFQRLQAEQQTNRQHVTNNTTYDDLVVASQRQEDNHTYTTLSYDK